MSNMTFLPIGFRLDKGVLIFGGGEVAERKIQILESFTPHITVVSKDTRALPDYATWIKTDITHHNFKNYLKEEIDLGILEGAD